MDYKIIGVVFYWLIAISKYLFNALVNDYEYLFLTLLAGIFYNFL
jgi:hypothetical protein